MIRLLSIHLTVSVLFLVSPFATHAKGPKITDPKKADADFWVQGEYVGQVKTDERDVNVGIQVIALGAGKFHAVFHVGGLPGEGTGEKKTLQADGETRDGVTTFLLEDARCTIKDGVATGWDAQGNKVGTLKRVVRKSPTLGKKPPANAVVLFDGSNVDAWEGGEMTSNGLLMQGTVSKQTFGSFKLHIEFCLPYQPEDSGQQRGNSGTYMQGRYELQMLDSFGLEGKQNECGGIYSVKAPDLNMCYPPLTWQTYDIEFVSAEYDSEGKLKANPRMTARHNGVLIHDRVELPGERSTTAAPVKPGPEPGPITLQDHGCPVRYRNIWLVRE